MLQILVADDHDVMRRGLCDLLLERTDWRVCAEARNGREAVEFAVQFRPDVAVLDISMPELSGLEATYQIRKQTPNTEVLIFTVYDTDQLVREVLRAGARGYVLKSDAALHLVEAVEALSKHQAFVTPGVSKTLITTFLNGGVEEEEEEPPQRLQEGGTPSNALTDREREVVQLLAQGKTNREVASLLVISHNTVETHRANSMRKLGVTSIVELVHYAIRTGLIRV